MFLNQSTAYKVKGVTLSPNSALSSQLYGAFSVF